MKPLLLCLCSLFLALPVLAQDLSLRMLLKLRETALPEVNRKLTRKGWTFVSDDKPTEGMMGKAIWAYQPAPSGEGATAWCVLYYNATSPTRILYNAYGGTAIPRMQQKIRRRKMGRLAEGQYLEGVQHLDNYTDYEDDHYVMRLLQYEQPNQYGIKIFERADYLKAKANGQL